MNISIIGAGNVSYHLAIAFHNEGHKITHIYNRTLQKATNIAKHVNSKATNSIDKLPLGNFNIIAVSDDYISSAAKELYNHLGADAQIVHTSGVLGIDALDVGFDYYGCFYPLQSLVSGERVDMTMVPICLDTNDRNFYSFLKSIAKTISKNVVTLSSEKKKYIHVAAVMANNFTNHMYTLAEEICEKHDLDFQVLLPLISKSTLKLEGKSPKEIQTGPAKRMDRSTINKHLKLIEDKDIRKIYRAITKSIIKTYHENN